MKQNEIIVGHKYVFVNNGKHEHKQPFTNQIVTVLNRTKGKVDRNAIFRNRKGKRPDRFLLDVGIYANAANLKPCNSID